jgi:hypothetical protein
MAKPQAPGIKSGRGGPQAKMTWRPVPSYLVVISMATACCNKCRRFTELVFAELVCEECGAALDKLWGESNAPDWVLIGVPARSWGSPPPTVGHFLHQNTSYPEMKARWASWPNPCEIRPATPSDVAASEERVRRGKASRLAALNYEKAKRQREREKAASNIEHDSTSPPATPKRRETITAEVRREVWRRDQGRCTSCGSNERLEFDHIIPVAMGGSNTARNLHLLCQTCNRKKGATLG